MPQRHMGGAEAQLHTFLTLALDGVEWSASCPDTLHPGKDHSIQWREGWVGPRASLGVMIKTKNPFTTLSGFKTWLSSL